MLQKVGALFKGPVAFVAFKGTLGRLMLSDRGVMRVFLRLRAFTWLRTSVDAWRANELQILVTGVPTLVVLTGCHVGMNLLMLP